MSYSSSRLSNETIKLSCNGSAGCAFKKLRVFILVSTKELGLKMYTRAIFFIIFIYISACTTINVKDSDEKILRSPSLTSILDSPGLEAFKLTLNQIVLERNPDTGQLQHFYVSNYSENENIAYMYWHEKKLLWIMSPGGTAEESWLGVRYPNSGQLINLKEGVVDSADKVGGSSYLVTKDWAAERLFETVIQGDLIIISQ